MALIRWQPLKDLDTLRHQMNHLFDELMHGNRELSSASTFGKVGLEPTIEIKETDTALIVRAAVPGIAIQDLDVQVGENVVSISGEYREEKRTEEKGYFHSELQYGQFQRVLPLPMTVQHEQVVSDFKDGVLTLTLPKAHTEQPTLTKVDLTIHEKARESIAQQRQQEDHLQHTMRTRATAEISAPERASTAEEAREAMATQRQQDEHLQDTMHRREADSIGAPANF
ncbi:Hsp20/alpha crystallin family protein [Leptolyngbya sp. AN02str]|uniref:Hsp20/alpha crystallin family protein n=1 Tax=Leptolyngbya sp. AN02str TaxID=3423363 RepID=UPI003D31B34E